MAHSKILVSNGMELKKAPIGFSWTMLFFGFFVPLIRGDYLWAVILLGLNIITSGVAAIVMAFFYNRMYLKGLFEKGYYIQSHDAKTTDDSIQTYVGLIKLPVRPVN